ncbi:hypothetical protein [Motiliproteus sediminis]|uniref:hypothetical protein n=1 Tax=Motiliproteus sediminis TaxID=1468178 RepID=UPI001AF01701|nr:hypothetical protein [Motiliproteus sediminis]
MEINTVADRYPDVAIRMGNRLLLWLVVLSGAVSAVIGSYLYLVSLRIAHERQSPPAALPVAFRTRMVAGEAALRVARNYRWVALLLWLQPVAGLGFWFWLSGGVI